MPIENRFYDVMRDGVNHGKPCKEIISPRFPTRDEARTWAGAHKAVGDTLYIVETTTFPDDGEIEMRARRFTT
jgi:hypothetical protein